MFLLRNKISLNYHHYFHLSGALDCLCLFLVFFLLPYLYKGIGRAVVVALA